MAEDTQAPTFPASESIPSPLGGFGFLALRPNGSMFRTGSIEGKGDGKGDGFIYAP